MENQDFFKIVEKINLQNGPEPEDFDALTFAINAIGELVKINKLTQEDVAALKSKCSFLQNKESIMGHIIAKPYGYAGDFHIIDRIYTNDISSSYPKWDNYSLLNSAAQAVRNRKNYFKEIVGQSMREGGSLLNIASGPARDLYEFYSENPTFDFKTTCVEMDEKAINYAKIVNTKFLNKIDFINKNIFYFETDKKFELIWSAGLFDYFDDRAFVLLLKKFSKWLKKDGQIVIGNFNDSNNPSRAYMELFGEWNLKHRTEEQLYSLAKEAGFKTENITVGREPENVNLFLHLRNY